MPVGMTDRLCAARERLPCVLFGAGLVLLSVTPGCAGHPSTGSANNPSTAGNGAVSASAGTGTSAAAAGSSSPGSVGSGGSPAAAGSPSVSGSSGSAAAAAGSDTSGQPGAAGSGGAAGAAGAAPAGKPGAIGGYMQRGDWKGFAWTATSMDGGTIMPMDFGAALDFPLCASGSVATGDSNVAMVGWNLNQSSVDGEPAMTVTPQLDGVTVAVSNKGGSELRLQLQGPNGATDADDRWCAIIPGNGGFIPYDAFSTECWAGGNGTAYAGQPLVAAIVLVPGTAGSAVDFDFCIEDLEETDANGMGSSSAGCSLSGSPGEGGGTITGSDTRVVTRDGRQYVVQNNVWGSGNSSGQALSVQGVSFSVTQQDNTAATNSAPASYPSVFIGSNFGHASSGSGLPKQVSALTSVKTGWKWSGGGSGQHNAAYDVWFSSGPGGDGGNPSGGYLMVWFASSDRSNVVPLGGSPAGTVAIGGQNWQYWICAGGCQNGVPVISYIPTSGSLNEWSFDLNDFIQHAVSTGTIKSEWYLTNVFAGFEIWSGGVGLKTENFCAVVN